MVLTDEFADLGRDFGALKAHLTNESARSPAKTCPGKGLTCHEQLSKGPYFTKLKAKSLDDIQDTITAKADGM